MIEAGNKIHHEGTKDTKIWNLIIYQDKSLVVQLKSIKPENQGS
jgi:hypothetical protein